MSDHWIEDAIIDLEFTDAERAQIVAGLPALQQFFALLQKDEADLTHMFMLGKSLLPTASMVVTRLKARMIS